VEEMLDANGEVDTEHSKFTVPFIMVDKRLERYPMQLPHGKLADIAPTILALMGLSKPDLMSGKNLLADVGL